MNFVFRIISIFFLISNQGFTRFCLDSNKSVLFCNFGTFIRLTWFLTSFNKPVSFIIRYRLLKPGVSFYKTSFRKIKFVH